MHDEKDLVNMQKILLKRCCDRLQKDTANIKPLTTQLSTLFGECSEGRGWVALLNESLCKMPKSLMKKNALIQLEMLGSCISNMDSILTELSEFLRG